MRSTRVQRAITVLAVAIAAAVLVHRGLPPQHGLQAVATSGDPAEFRRCIAWQVSVEPRSETWKDLVRAGLEYGNRAIAEFLVEPVRCVDGACVRMIVSFQEP